MAGYDAFGTQFKRDSTGMGVFVAIANVTDISGPSRTREALDVTAHDSADQYMEFVKGLKDAGEVEITLNYSPAGSGSGHGLLDDDFEEDALRDYQIVVRPGQANEVTWEFSALITDLGDEFPYDDKMERSATFKISGKPTLTATGS